MSALVLAAASGLARETLVAARAQGCHEVVGFVDDDHSLWGQVIDGVEVLGGLDVLADRSDVVVCLCAGKGLSRQRMAERLNLARSRYATIVHPSVEIPTSCTVGAGSILLAGTVLTTAVSVGEHVVVMPNVTLTHDDVVADFATLCAAVALGGSVTVGQRAYLGMAASVREGVTVGADATVGMGSVVLHDVPTAQTWLGVPAKSSDGARAKSSARSAIRS